MPMPHYSKLRMGCIFRMAIILDKGVTGLLIVKSLAVFALHLPHRSLPGPTTVSFVSTDISSPLLPPAQVLLALGDAPQLPEAIDMLALDLAPGHDITRRRNSMSSHHLRFQCHCWQELS